jgi:hypothetical protein
MAAVAAWIAFFNLLTGIFIAILVFATMYAKDYQADAA